MYDLTGIPDLEKKTVKLAPDSGYYPNTYLSPNDADSTAAESTDRFAEIRTDYLSQRLVLRLPDNSDTYALTALLAGRPDDDDDDDFADAGALWKGAFTSEDSKNTPSFKDYSEKSFRFAFTSNEAITTALHR